MATYTKVTALAVVAMMMFTGLALLSTDDSESVPVSNPLAYVDGTTESVTSPVVAIGSFIRIATTANNPLVGITSAGTTIANNGGLTSSSTYVEGFISESTAISGGIIRIEYNNLTLGESEYIDLDVEDMSSTSSNPFGNLNIPANVAYYLNNATNYIRVGSSMTISASGVPEVNPDDLTNFAVTSVTSGYGLSVSSGSLTGTISQSGTITVGISNSNGASRNITFNAVASNDFDVRMVSGQTYSYTPTFAPADATLSISGTATNWLTLSSGTISGTAPSGVSVGTTYSLVITATSTNPSQTATQNVTFYVDPQITATVSPATVNVAFGGSVSANAGSNFEDNSRNIYTISGSSLGLTVNSVTGDITGVPSTSGTITIVATSPYAYNSGTNTASVTLTVTVQDTLTITKSANTLYLVTGKSVPNTPAENITFSHNNIGTGTTYTYSIVGTNNTGVTISNAGVLGGTPGNTGSYTITVRLTATLNGVTQTADTTLDVYIEQVLAFTSLPTVGTVS